MPKNLEERRLLHQKGQQPTYGNGVPNNDEGMDGDLSYRKINNKHIQFLKQDGRWNEVGSSSSVQSSSNEFEKGFIESELDFRNLLYKYRDTIMSWNYNWVVHGMFGVDFVIDGSLNYMQFTTGLTTQGVGVPGSVFSVPRECYLSNINFILSVPQNTLPHNVSWGFDLNVFETDVINESNSFGNVVSNYMTLDYQNGGQGIVRFGATIIPEGSKAIVNIPVGAYLNTDRGYALAVEQIQDAEYQGTACSKGISWSAYFKST